MINNQQLLIGILKYLNKNNFWRPNLERFHSIELEGGGGGDKLKQEENENEEKVNNTKDNPDINSISNQKIDDTSH